MSPSCRGAIEGGGGGRRQHRLPLHQSPRTLRLNISNYSPRFQPAQMLIATGRASTIRDGTRKLSPNGLYLQLQLETLQGATKAGPSCIFS